MLALHHPSGPVETSDLALLDLLTAPTRPTAKTILPRRDAALDPLLIAAAAASGPHVTRNHYHHDFFPGVMVPQAEGAWDWTKWTPEDAGNKPERKRLAYVSRQAPRRQRLAAAASEEAKENEIARGTDVLKVVDNLPAAPKKRKASLSSAQHKPISEESIHKPILPASDATALAEALTNVTPSVEVKCMARTRIPTPHGLAFLHLYHNNRDSKEHLAIVIDPAQFSEDPTPAPPIRSRSLDAVWNENESEMDRITRGAYVGRLSPTSQRASDPASLASTPSLIPQSAIPTPLIRIHSECFTGETVGSMRCDCGEQLDEAIRQISLPEGVRVLTNNPDKVEALRKEGIRITERVPMIPRSWQQRKQKADVKKFVEDKEAITVVQKAEKERISGATLIGGNAVHGADLDKYLRTKVLRMGHMLPLWLDDTVSDSSVY
ncbi:putative GTP cyclohydrolase-2 [Leucoagaricus sp. SymC.cos]|nr:putative GTP cyclohydrolase-2 [Leucoagaricus sp. SymC.cos]